MSFNTGNHYTFINGHSFGKEMAAITPLRNKMHLSHGLNDLSIPTIFKEIMLKDINDEGFRNYGDILLDRILTSLVLTNLNIKYSVNLELGHCEVIESGTYAINCVSHYIKGKKNKKHKALLLGLNYYLLYEILYKIGFEVITLPSNNIKTPQPKITDVIDKIAKINPDLLIISHPSNPSGEIYSDSDINLLLENCKLYETFVLFDFICGDCDNKLTNKNNILQEYIIYDNIAIIDSIVKRRSCGGIRTAFVIGSTKLMEYIDYCNETMIFYPPFLGIKVTIAEIYFQSILYVKKKCSYEYAVNIISKQIETIGNFTKLKINVKDEIDKIIPNNDEFVFETYQGEILKNQNIIKSNEFSFQHSLSHHIIEKTKISSGFSFATIFNNPQKMNQKEFCFDIYHKTGVYLHPDLCFGNSELFNQIFWIRIGCAILPYNFNEGIKRLLDYLEKQ
jgi:aspartate/methionine/tyrosine aminotransferase